MLIQTMFQHKLYRLYRKLHMFLFGVKPGCFIQNPQMVNVGRNVFISHGVHIYVQNHKVDNVKQMDVFDPVCIGDDCWLGANVIVLPGVFLGNGTVVAAGAVVTKSFFEGDCVIGGVPAKIIKRKKLN